MLTRDQDFEVYGQGFLRCRPKNPAAASAFKALQITVQRLVPQLPDAPAYEITIDGEIGPALVLAVQLLLRRLGESGHQDLAPLAVAQPEEAIPATAAMSLEIAGYLDAVLAREPTALLAPKREPLTGPDPIQLIKSLLTPKRIAASVGVLAGITGLALAAHATDRRALGVVDRSGLLPPSDGSDDFGEDGDENEGGEPEGDSAGEDEHGEEPTTEPTPLPLPPPPTVESAAA
jgi:hypothetical protein